MKGKPKYCLSGIVIWITFFSLSLGWAQTELDFYMANPEVRLGQKVYCQIKNPGAADKLQAFLDGKLSFEKSSNLQSEEIILLDYRALTAGKHQLTVKIVNSRSNTTVAEKHREWRTLHDGIPQVGINADNAICLEGTPFFPITSWMLNKSDFESPIAGVINSLLAEGWEQQNTLETWKEYLRLARSYGFYVAGPNRWQGFNTENPRNSDLARLIDYVQQTRDFSNSLLAWFWDDEPDAGGQEKYNPATSIYAWTQLTHQYDTNHPVWVNLVGYNFTHGESEWHKNLIKEYCYLYNESRFGGQKTAVADIISLDYYPYEYANHSSWSSWLSLEDYTLALDRLRTWNYDLLPITTCIETQDLHDYYGIGHENPCGFPRDYPWTPGITASQLKNLIWVSIIHGVKGITYFHHFCPTPDENILVLQEARDQIEYLTPVILGPDSEILVRDEELDGGRIDVMTKSYVGNPIIFAANLKNQNERVKFTISGLATNKSIYVYGEDRSLSANDGFFIDSFMPLAVHIYMVQMTETDAIPPLPPEEIRLNYH